MHTTERLRLTWQSFRPIMVMCQPLFLRPTRVICSSTSPATSLHDGKERSEVAVRAVPVKSFVTLQRFDLRVQFAQLLTNGAGSEIDMSVVNRKSDYFDTLQVSCSDPGFFRETQRVVASYERRSSTLRIRIVAHHCHPDSVHIDGVAAGNDHARCHLFQARKPRTFPSPHRLDSINDRNINGPNTVLIDQNARNPITRIARRIRMQLGIYSGGRRRRSAVQHIPALFRRP